MQPQMNTRRMMILYPRRMFPPILSKIWWRSWEWPIFVTKVIMIFTNPNAPTLIGHKLPTGTKMSKSLPALKVKVHPKDTRQTKAITADSDVECNSRYTK